MSYEVPEETHSDLSERVIVHAKSLRPIPSGQEGVSRRILERNRSGEVARATSVVDYAPGSYFPEHIHGGGEEFLVLSGTFSDLTGDYSAGAYVRNPPGSRHAPYTEEGCCLFVKLCQMDSTDTQQWVNKVDANCLQSTDFAGLSRQPLFARQGYEEVAIERLLPGSTLESPDPLDGEEMLVLEGEVFCDGVKCGPLSWLRIPAGEPMQLTAGANGCSYWVKRGHFSSQVQLSNTT